VNVAEHLSASCHIALYLEIALTSHIGTSW
jgi:hypothetical protein